MNIYEESYTYLFNHVEYKTNEDDICECFNTLPGWTPPMECYCDAPDDPRVYASMIHVRVVGEPIKTRPMDSTYTIRIYETECRESKVSSSLFKENDIVTEFSIHDTISRDHDKTHVDYLRKYVPKTSYVEKYKFIALECRDNYLKAFRRISDIYTKSGDPEPISENAHVAPRKKNKLDRKREKRLKIKK